MAEGIFQSKPDITSSGETNDFGHGFFNQRREYETDKALILKVSFHIFRFGWEEEESEAIVIRGTATEPSTWLKRF